MGETPNSLTGSFTKHNFKLTGSYKPARTLNIEYSLNYIVQDVKDRPQTSLNLYGSFSNMFSSFMDIPYLKQSYVTSLGCRNTYAGGDATTDTGRSLGIRPGIPERRIEYALEHVSPPQQGDREPPHRYDTPHLADNQLAESARPASTDITDTKQTLEYETERPNSLYDPSGSFRTSTDVMTSCTAM